MSNNFAWTQLTPLLLLHSTKIKYYIKLFVYFSSSVDQYIQYNRYIDQFYNDRILYCNNNKLSYNQDHNDYVNKLMKEVSEEMNESKTHLRFSQRLPYQPALHTQAPAVKV